MDSAQEWDVLGGGLRVDIGAVTSGSTYTIQNVGPYDVYLVWSTTNGINAIIKRLYDDAVDILFKGERWDNFIQASSSASNNEIYLTFTIDISTGLHYKRIA